MGEDTSKSKNDQSDSEAFDIAVRRDDTQSLDDITDETNEINTADESTIEASSFEEKEVTLPVESSVESSFDEPTPTIETSTPDDTEPVSPPSSSPKEPEVGANTVEPNPVVPVTPVAAAPLEGTATDVTQHPSNNPGVLVLQWLSYAFWGWFGTSLAVLASITFGYFIAGSDATFWGDSLAYPLAAVIVMLVIALVADFFYARVEPAQKRGAASIIMLIHAVVYSLVVVAAIIGIVFSIISMIITAEPINTMDGTKVFMLTALITAVTYAAVSLRALFGGKKRGVRKALWLMMSVLALGFVIVSIAGPAMKANSTKADRLVESALPTLASDIRRYTRANDKLPASLDDIKSTYSNVSNGQVQALVDKDLVKYKPNTRPSTTDMEETTTSSTTTKPMTRACATREECAKGMTVEYDNTTNLQAPSSQRSIKTFYYQLCVTYKEIKSSKYSITRYESDDYVASTVNTSTHPKGEVCYDVAAEGKMPSMKF